MSLVIDTATEPDHRVAFAGPSGLWDAMVTAVLEPRDDQPVVVDCSTAATEGPIIDLGDGDAHLGYLARAGLDRAVAVLG